MEFRDFQFVNSFLREFPEIEIDPELNVKIIIDSNKDHCVISGKTIEIHSPTLISKTLFNLIYHLSEKNINSPHKKDIFSISLSEIIYNHIYKDDTEVHKPPVLLSASKLPIPTMIIKEIIEPIINKELDMMPVLFLECPYTDSCRIVNSYTEFCDAYKFSSNIIPFTKYPFILCNSSIKNKPAIHSHVLLLQLEHSIKYKQTKNMIKKILLDDKETALDGMIKILYSFGNRPDFVDEFLTYLKSYSKISGRDVEQFIISIKAHCDKHSELNKIAQFENASVQKQWTQWSTLSGLTEKQLEGMRGSKRELSENMKDIDKEFELLKQKKRKKLNKKILNNEEQLEVARERYNTNAVEPGKLYEVLLNDVRNW